MNRSAIRKQSGQAVVEIVLLLVLTGAFSLMVSRYLQDSKFAQKLITQPWQVLSGMIECGVWTGCKPGMHPHDRILSYRPED